MPYDTGIPFSEYGCGIVGMYGHDGDIDEGNKGRDERLFLMQAAVHNGTWHVEADFRSHNKHEDWRATILCAQRGHWSVPLVDFVAPASGPESGGAPVKLSGRNFEVEGFTVTEVTFGDHAASSLTVVDDRRIDAVSPTVPVGTGAVHVRVGNVSGLSETHDSNEYVFLPVNPGAPNVGGLLPKHGPRVGTTAVVITGTRFSQPPVTSVTFGGVHALGFSVLGDTQIVALSPPGQGTVDVLVANADGSSMNTGADDFTYVTVRGGGFDRRANFSANEEPRGITHGDFDGDGKVDIATADTGSSTVSVLRNVGVGANIAFADKLNWEAGSNPWDITAADFDGDGKVDLVTSNLGGQDALSVFRNTSTGPGAISFEPRVDFESFGYAPRTVTVGDFDGDGRTDLATVDGFYYNLVVLRNASPSVGVIDFDLPIAVESNAVPFGVVAADFDADGMTDLATSDLGSSTLSVYLNASGGLGQIAFTRRDSYLVGGGPTGVTAGDFDGDDQLDLASAVQGSDSLSVIRNVSTAGISSFEPAISFSTGERAQDVAVGDFNFDGKLDLASADEDSDSVSILFNRSAGAGDIDFSSRQSYLTGDAPTGITAADFNGDGLLDIAVTNSIAGTVSVFRNGVPREDRGDDNPN